MHTPTWAVSAASYETNDAGHSGTYEPEGIPMSNEVTIKPLVRRIAKIKSTHLGYEDHGIFTAFLYVDFGGSSQGVGGHGMDEPRRDADGKFIGRFGTAYGMEWIARAMRACGVQKWEDLPGRTIHVLCEGDGWNAKVHGIENLPTEQGETFIFNELRAEFFGDDNA